MFFGNLSNNPGSEDIVGKIVKVGGNYLPVKVRWKDGSTNIYNELDLGLSDGVRYEDEDI
jgi:hypothetical protein